jgi:hypothetical protein
MTPTPPSAIKSLPEGTPASLDLMNEKLFDRQDLLLMLHISVRTLQYWRSKGILPYHKIRNKIYYRQRDVEEMLKKSRMAGKR